MPQPWDLAGSYYGARQGAQKTRVGDIELQGQEAFGNTLKLWQGQAQVPGAQGMPGQTMPGGGAMPQQGSPPPPAGGAPPSFPGAQQMPQQRPPGAMPGASPMQLQGQPIQPMGGASMQLGGGQPGAMPQGAMGGPQGGQPQGQLDWRQIIQKVVQANPGAKPAVIAAAVDKFLPLMNQQSQQEWRMANLQMRGDIADLQARSRERGQDIRADTAAGGQAVTARGQDVRAGTQERGQDIRADTAKRGQDIHERIADAKSAAAMDRLKLSSQTKIEVSMLSNDTKREIAALVQSRLDWRQLMSENSKRELEGMKEDARREIINTLESGKAERQGVAEEGKSKRQGVAEEGKDYRAALSAETKLAMNKLSIEAKREIAAAMESGRDRRANLSSETKKEIANLSVAARNELADKLEAGRDRRSAAGIESREGTAAKKEAGVESRFGRRQDAQADKLKFTRDQAKMKAERDGRAESLKLWEAARKAHDNYERQKISTSSQMITASDRKARLKELDAEWAADSIKIQELKRRGASGMGLNGGGQTQSGTSLPPEARKQLQEGHITEFNNGQRWTLKNGQPEQVQ